MSAIGSVDISDASHRFLWGRSCGLLLFFPQFLLEEEIFQHIFLQPKVSFHINALRAQKKGSQQVGHFAKHACYELKIHTSQLWSCYKQCWRGKKNRISVTRTNSPRTKRKNLPHPLRRLWDFWGFLIHAAFLAHLSQPGSAAWLCRNRILVKMHLLFGRNQFSRIFLILNRLGRQCSFSRSSINRTSSICIV